MPENKNDKLQPQQDKPKPPTQTASSAKPATTSDEKPVRVNREQATSESGTLTTTAAGEAFNERTSALAQDLKDSAEARRLGRDDPPAEGQTRHQDDPDQDGRTETVPEDLRDFFSKGGAVHPTQLEDGDGTPTEETDEPLPAPGAPVPIHSGTPLAQMEVNVAENPVMAAMAAFIRANGGELRITPGELAASATALNEGETWQVEIAERAGEGLYLYARRA